MTGFMPLLVGQAGDTGYRRSLTGLPIHKGPRMQTLDKYVPRAMLAGLTEVSTHHTALNFSPISP